MAERPKKLCVYFYHPAYHLYETFDAVLTLYSTQHAGKFPSNDRYPLTANTAELLRQLHERSMLGHNQIGLDGLIPLDVSLFTYYNSYKHTRISTDQSFADATCTVLILNKCLNMNASTLMLQCRPPLPTALCNCGHSYRACDYESAGKAAVCLPAPHYARELDVFRLQCPGKKRGCLVEYDGKQHGLFVHSNHTFIGKRLLFNALNCLIRTGMPWEAFVDLEKQQYDEDIACEMAALAITTDQLQPPDRDGQQQTDRGANQPTENDQATTSSQQRLAAHDQPTTLNRNGQKTFQPPPSGRLPLVSANSLRSAAVSFMFELDQTHAPGQVCSKCGLEPDVLAGDATMAHMPSEYYHGKDITERDASHVTVKRQHMRRDRQFCTNPSNRLQLMDALRGFGEMFHSMGRDGYRPSSTLERDQDAQYTALNASIGAGYPISDLVTLLYEGRASLSSDHQKGVGLFFKSLGADSAVLSYCPNCIVDGIADVLERTKTPPAEGEQSELLPEELLGLIAKETPLLHSVMCAAWSIRPMDKIGEVAVGHPLRGLLETLVQRWRPR